MSTQWYHWPIAGSPVPGDVVVAVGPREVGGQAMSWIGRLTKTQHVGGGVVRLPTWHLGTGSPATDRGRTGHLGTGGPHVAPGLPLATGGPVTTRHHLAHALRTRAALVSPLAPLGVLRVTVLHLLAAVLECPHG